MNIWFFIILVVALALVLGPISMLKPKPAQKRRENLRLYANQRGVRYTLRRPPVLSTDIEQPEPMPVYYLPPAAKTPTESEWILMRTHYVHEGNFYQEWDWQTATRPCDDVCQCLKIYLPDLPASVIAITQGSLGICVFWSEKEDKETLELLIDMMEKLRQLT
ncbi:hypothetical protein [Cellvibrio sp. UBA7661]|uniref:hypothetical protein n=1 Tax=Cellvibrio sp. UBA7661 TaxID=1946311 RepID=UPI002F360A33